MCEENRASCQSPTALQFLAIVDSGRALGGRARIGEINRAINLKLKPASDLALYGAEDVWSSPLATFATGAGDCEDYAIAKFVALQEAGISADDLRIVILRDDHREEDHAVVAARLDGHWLMLDNRHMVLVEDHDVRRYPRKQPRRHPTVASRTPNRIRLSPCFNGREAQPWMYWLRQPGGRSTRCAAFWPGQCARS